MKSLWGNAYEDPAVVAFYSRHELQPPEAYILEQQRSFLSRARMLDLGVGAGRTTHHFAPAVKEYTGVDYSKPMVAKCRELFAEKYRFECLDARTLTELPAERFEFVLFSFNGLDIFNNPVRTEVMRDIYRLLSPGGLFCFSAHNLRALPHILERQSAGGILAKVKGRLKNGLQMILNPPLSRMLQAESVMVHDGTHAFRVRNFYIKPEVDWRTLENLGFTDISAYRLTDGQPFPSKATLTKAEDPWVYFTAQKPTV